MTAPRTLMRRLDEAVALARLRGCNNCARLESENRALREELAAIRAGQHMDKIIEEDRD